MVSLVCEWLFSLVKAEVDQSFLKSCQEKNNPEPGFLSSFVPTIFFFYLAFLSQPITNHRTAGEEVGAFL